MDKPVSQQVIGDGNLLADKAHLVGVVFGTFKSAFRQHKPERKSQHTVDVFYPVGQQLDTRFVNGVNIASLHRWMDFAERADRQVARIACRKSSDVCR